MKISRTLGLLIIALLVFSITTAGTYSYLTSTSTTNVLSFKLGDINIETDNKSWRYVPASITNTDRDSNEFIKSEQLSSNIDLSNLRPGDAFEKEITLNNNGSIDTKLKITKGKLAKDSPFKLSIAVKDSLYKIVQDTKNSDVFYLDNLKSNSKVIFTVRLEIPTQLSNKDINEDNIKFSNNALELIDIIATQWNNEAWSE
ncbi:CalY family protein [Clostridium omnivorum]|uniref:Camelysin metallo-endopeptidase n=1 Tax=Clostridium omnivorum TaxID=1604902 RepID=A0ABQ5N5P7_9CLOT|nr:CalY family protein [Clostridium sp. E14]GLC30529.1 hypothetical protein bsdE14_19390 [Clostridium sp. E14]